MTEESIRVLSAIKDAEANQKNKIAEAKVQVQERIAKARAYAENIDARVKERVAKESESEREQAGKSADEELQKLENQFRSLRDELQKAAKANEDAALKEAGRLFNQSITGSDENA